MAKLNIWMLSPYDYEISDEELATIKKDIAESNTKAIENFISGIEQTFGAGYFGDATITDIYDNDGNPLGRG